MSAEARPRHGWRIHRFDEIATNVNERVDDPSEAGVEYYVGLEHLDSDSLVIRRWGSPTDVQATKLRFRKGDIIFGRRRVYQRKLGVAHFDGICSAHAMVLRARSDVLWPEFLPFFMQSDLFMERAKEISVGSLSPTINWPALAREEFLLPPLDEQRRITRALQSMEGVAASLANTRATLDLVRRADLTEFFEGRKAEAVPLPEVARIVAGGTPSKGRPDYWGGTRLWASGKDLKTSELLDTEDRLTESGWAEATVAPKGSTLVVVRGMILAHSFPVARCVADTAFNQDLRALIAGDSVTPDYLFLWTQWAAPWFLSRTAMSSHGTKRIEGRVFSDAMIPVPDRAIQSEFVERHRQFEGTESMLRSRIADHVNVRRTFLDQAFGRAQ
jgi:type I restriction enzyme S subunit